MTNNSGDKTMNANLQNVSIKGMRGDYSRYALTQYNAVNRGLDTAVEKLIKPAAARLSGSQFRMVDLGSADGVNGFPVIDAFANALRPSLSTPNPQLSVFHLDVPTADFKTLTDNIYSHPDSYHARLKDRFEVQPAILPGSFYAPYVEAQSAEVVFSTTALHYGSRSAGPITGHIEPLYARGDQKSKWNQLSREDLDSILQQAHRALKPGGVFWAVAPAHTTDDQGQIANHWNKEVWNVMIELLENMNRNGELDSKSWEEFVIPVHQRHIDEWQDWFDRHPEKFKLEFLEVVESQNPYLDFYLHEHRDPNRFADDYLGFFRAWGERIAGTLIPEEQQREAFYAKLHQAFKSDPERFANDNVSVYAGATRL